MAIKINGNTVIADNQAFTTTSTISATGNITGGNLSVIGTITAAGINTGSSPISTTGNVVGGNILTGGTVSATGNITGGNVSATNLTGTLLTAAQTNITSVGTLTSLNSGVISSSGNVTGANLLTAGLISSTGNITGGNVSATNLTGTLTTAAQTNITSVGTLTALSVTGTVQGGNVSTAGTVSATGNITGGNLLINGSTVITGNLTVQGTETIFNVANLTVNDKDIIVANNVTGGANVNGSGIQAGNPGVATWFYNNATLSWQSNIAITPTTNGTLNLGGASNFWGTAYLASASVTGNVQGGNILTAGLISATGAVTGAALTGTSLTVSTGNITGGNLLLSGAIVDSAQLDIQTSASNANIALAPNGTGIVTVSTQVSAVGNVTGGNIRTAGLISATGAITGAAITGTSLTVSTGNVTAGNLILSGAIEDSAQLDLRTTASNANIVLTPNGTGNVNISSNVMPTANATANIGSATLSFNTIFAKATSAQYADLAEKYTADAEYAPGTVVVFGGSAEVTVDAVDADRRVAGVVSTNPSYIMNAGCEGTNVATVALTGRVPCLVTGLVRKGDLMVAAGLGRARAEADPRVGTVIGKALEDHDGESGTIEVVVGRF
jgi:hypothetical protein